MSKVLLVSIGLKSNRKKILKLLLVLFFMLLIVKSSKTLPKNSAQSFISELFTLIDVLL